MTWTWSRSRRSVEVSHEQRHRCKFFFIPFILIFLISRAGNSLEYVVPPCRLTRAAFGCRYRLDGLPNATGDSYSLWLNEMVDHFGVTADTSLLQAAATDIVSHFKSDITGKIQTRCWCALSFSNLSLSFYFHIPFLTTSPSNLFLLPFPHFLY